MNNDNKPTFDKHDLVVNDNQKASDKNATIGEAPIVRYDEINPAHFGFEDIDEVQSTDDV